MISKWDHDKVKRELAEEKHKVVESAKTIQFMNTRVLELEKALGQLIRDVEHNMGPAWLCLAARKVLNGNLDTNA